MIKTQAVERYKEIHITLKNGEISTWSEAVEWDDYLYNGTAFIIKKNGEWVGIYNMDTVANIVVK